MSNTVIQLKNSTVTGNVPSSLANGEISINNRDGKFFYSTPAGVVITHYPYLGPAGLNQEVQFNDSGVLGSDSGLTYNKTTDVLTINGAALVAGINVVPQIASAFLQANTPDYVANSAASYANSAFLKANTPDYVANSAASYANAAFVQANTDYTTISTTAGTYGNATFVPVFTVAANGRIVSVTNTAITSTGGATLGDVLALSIALG